MYEELVKRLRTTYDADVIKNHGILLEAADAIEELSQEYESVAKSLTESVELVRKLQSPRWVSVMEPPKEEIVRCKDCEHWMPDGENVMVCTGPMAYSKTDEAWYCASAKRR